MHTGKIILLCIACIPLLFSSSQGAIQTYEDKTLFINETISLDVIENYTITGEQSSFTFTNGGESITISAEVFFTDEATSLLPDIELRISLGAEVSSSENIDVLLAGDRYGFGFDMVEPIFRPRVGLTFYRLTL